jgi:hypothetical protein
MGLISPGPTTVSAGVIEDSYGWFDSCGSDANVSHLQTVWNDSLYYGIGVYVRGPCFIPTPSWTSAVEQQGWGLMAIWQGGRTCGSVDGTVAQGVRDAGGNSTGYGQNVPNTLADLQSHGFGTWATVALDVEGSWPSSCDIAVGNYINGWVWQTRQNSLHPVVYGSGSGAIRTTVENVTRPGQNNPDAIWPACPVNNPLTESHGGEGCPGNSVWNVPSLPSDYWVFDQRHTQWTHGHYETYGGVQLCVDDNAADSIISWGDPGNHWTSGENETNDGPAEDPASGYAPLNAGGACS